MFEVYQHSLIGLWLILSTIIIQAMVAVRVHRRQKGGYMPGIVKTELDHSSIVFRTYRTYQNSIENVIPIFGMSVIAILSEYSAYKLSIIIWGLCYSKNYTYGFILQNCYKEKSQSEKYFLGNWLSSKFIFYGRFRNISYFIKLKALFIKFLK